MTATPQPQHRNLDPAAVDALVLDTTPWLSCDECFERMDTYVESLLSASSDHDHPDPAMAKHLAGCGACDEEAQSLMALLAQDT